MKPRHRHRKRMPKELRRMRDLERWRRRSAAWLAQGLGSHGQALTLDKHPELRALRHADKAAYLKAWRGKRRWQAITNDVEKNYNAWRAGLDVRVPDPLDHLKLKEAA